MAIHNIAALYNKKNQRIGYGIIIDGDDSEVNENAWASWDFPDAETLHFINNKPEAPTDYNIPLTDLQIAGVNYPDQTTVNGALLLLFPGDPLTEVATDGVTITGTGKAGDPLTVIGGGGGGTIPAIIMLETRANELFYYFLPGSLSFLALPNPEIFLFRQAKKVGKRGSHIIVHGQKWVHTSDRNRETKWAGWKFFRGNTPVERDTEFTISTILKANERQLLSSFNRAIYRISPEGFDTVSDGTYTVNDFLTRVVKLTGSNWRKGSWAPAMVLKMLLVIAVDNPAATQENGLCPKLFIAASDPFYTYPKFVGNAGDGSGRAEIRISKDTRKSKNRLVHG